MKKMIFTAIALIGTSLLAAVVAQAAPCPDFNSTVTEMKGGRYHFSEFGLTPASVVAWATVCPIEQITWLQPQLCEIRIASWKTIVQGAQDSFSAGESTQEAITNAQARLALAEKSCGK